MPSIESRRAFLRGWASSLDYVGFSRLSIPNPATGAQRDAAALAADWQAVGGDMWSALGAIKSEAGCVTA